MYSDAEHAGISVPKSTLHINLIFVYPANQPASQQPGRKLRTGAL
jgi:hypothetical protein